MVVPKMIQMIQITKIINKLNLPEGSIINRVFIPIRYLISSKSRKKQFIIRLVSLKILI